MRAGSPTARRGGWHRVDVFDTKLALIGAKLRQAGFVACHDDPVQAHCHFDRQGRLRHIHARYADGWRATLNIGPTGSYSLSMALRLTTKVPPA